MPHTATSSMIAGHVVAVPTGVARSRGVSCSQETQATVYTTTTATQCALKFLSSSGSQTEEEEFQGSEIDDPKAGVPFGRIPTPPHIGANNTAEALAGQLVNHVCSSHSSNTGELQIDHKGIHLRRTLHPSRSCQQPSHTETNTDTNGKKSTHICTVCGKMFGKNASCSCTGDYAPASRPTCLESVSTDLQRKLDLSLTRDRSPTAVFVRRVLLERGMSYPDRYSKSVRKLLLDKGLVSDQRNCTPPRPAMSLRKLLSDTKAKAPLSAASFRKLLLEKKLL